MKTIIAGGRDFTDMDALCSAIVYAPWRITEVVSGGAPGADSLGEQWAKATGVPVKRFPADWRKHGKAAGPIRNQQMAEYADALIALPGGRGTADMVRRAKAAGLKVFVRTS